MAEDLQNLLDRIQKDGVDKAEAEAEQIITDARKQAQQIIDDAKAEQARAQQAGAAEAAQLEARGERALEQAARDTILSVSDTLGRLMNEVIGQEVSAATSSPGLADLVARTVEAYAKSGERVDVLVSDADRAAVAAAVTARLSANAASGIEVKSEGSAIGGFQIRTEGGRITHDFSNEAIAEALASLLRPHLAEITRKAIAGETTS